MQNLNVSVEMSENGASVGDVIELANTCNGATVNGELACYVEYAFTPNVFENFDIIYKQSWTDTDTGVTKENTHKVRSNVQSYPY